MIQPSAWLSPLDSKGIYPYSCSPCFSSSGITSGVQQRTRNKHLLSWFSSSSPELLGLNMISFFFYWRRKIPFLLKIRCSGLHRFTCSYHVLEFFKQPEADNKCPSLIQRLQKRLLFTMSRSFPYYKWHS